MSILKGPKYFFHSNFNLKNTFILTKAYNKIKKSGLFDEKFYLKHYPDAKKTLMDPLEYYLIYGYKKGHLPSLDFDSNFYLNTYPDVKHSGMNPLLHYVLYGKKEGKLIQKSPAIIRKEEIENTNLNLLTNYKFDKEPLVSIIILNRDGIDHLKRLFNDFDNKTNYENYEIIVVDNASSDESVNYLKELSYDLPIKIIENKVNVSFSQGNNDAVKIANGEYVLLLNNDIEPTFGWLNEMMGVMLNNENIGAVGAKLIFPYYFKDKMNKKSFTIQHSGDIFSERIYPCCLYAKNKSHKNGIFDSSVNGNNECIAVTGAVMLIKKSVYEKFDGLNEEYFYGLEDVDFTLKLHKNNYKTIYCGNALLFHHESSTRSKDKKYVDNDKRNFNIFWQSWGDYLSKNLLLDKINNKKFFTEKKLKIIFADIDFNINKNSNKMIKEISNEFYNLNYDIDLITDKTDHFCGSSSDILISFSLDFSIEKLDARDDIVKVLSLNNFNFSEGDDFSKLKYYDIVICSKNYIYKYLKDNKLYNKFIFNFNNDSPEEYCENLLTNIEAILKNNEGFL
ncbi:glycosyltransferase family 2 protein [Methanobrevibacter sp. DSM 116169]|uniref:glycosyltransferase family 2 protein n=1 Tax=Methanobrevibacter sp. DSM 116169 TaxID=3242727 RepID=UPI0038FC447F